MKHVLVPTLALVLLAGCAGSDATSAYNDIEGRVGPITGAPHVKQQVATRTAFKVDVVDEQGLVFVIGQEASFDVKADVIDGLNYSLQLKNQPKGMKLENGAEAGTYKVSWKPGSQAIPFGQQSEQFKVDFVLTYDEKSSTPESIAAFKLEKQAQVHKETVTVKRIVQQPTVKISDATPVPATVQEGQSFTFTIEVTDASADAQNPPRINFAKVPGIDGSVLIRDDLKGQGLKQTKPGVWTGTRVFEANLANLPESVKTTHKIGEASASFNVEFGYVVYSASGLEAATQVKTVAFQLDKNFAAPELSVGMGRNNVIKRAVNNTITIMAVSKNQRANVVIDIEKLKQSVAALPGNPTVNCPAKKSSYIETCTVVVKVDCAAQELQSEYTFSVESGSTLFGETKTAKKDQVVKLAPVCPVKRVAAPKAGKK